MLTDLRKNIDLLVVVAVAIIAYHVWTRRHGAPAFLAGLKGPA